MATSSTSLWRRAAGRVLLAAAVATLGVAWLFIFRAQIAAAAPPSMAQKQLRAPKSLRLYIFNCGKLAIADISVYGFTKDQLATTDMSVACFLIAHPKGTL